MEGFGFLIVVITAGLCSLGWVGYLAKRRDDRSDTAGQITALLAFNALLFTTYFSAVAQLSAERVKTLTQIQVDAETKPAAVMSCSLTPLNAYSDSVLSIVPNHGSLVTSEARVAAPRPLVECIVANYGRLPILNGHLDFQYTSLPMGPSATMPRHLTFKQADVPILGIAAGGKFVVWIFNAGCDAPAEAPATVNIIVPKSIKYGTPVDPTSRPEPLVSESSTTFTIPPAGMSGSPPRCLPPGHSK